MALQKASLDGQEESVWQRCGQQAQRLQGESEDDARKKTFTRWMNVFLQRCEPPIEVQDLFTDIQDGRVLLALLEELSGYKLLYRFRPSSHRIFRLNNIAKALAFLDDRHVKLLSIDASGIADGIHTVVLNLVWNIILFFQIKEVTGGLQKRFSSSLSSLSISSYPSSSDLSTQPDDISTYSNSTLPSKGRRAARTPKYHGKAIKTLLHWVQRCTSKFGVEVYDFGKSWMSGLAFLAMIKSIDPGLVDLRDSLSREPRENVQVAFMIAQHSLGIPPLLDPEDVTHNLPDEQSIITYVSMFLEHYSGLDEDNKTDFGRSISIPEIPSFGETFDPHPDAQASFPSQPKTNEQLLWRSWSTSSKEPHHAASSHLNGQLTSDSSNNKSMASSHNLKSRGSNADVKKGCRNSVSVIRPNSPLCLDIDTVDQDIWTWMEKATTNRADSRLCVDEGNFSQSSEEGVYSLSVLDSDEEDAYSYILDLSGEALVRPSNELSGQAPGVHKMETTAGIISSLRLMGESKALNVSEVLVDNGRERDSKLQEALVTQNGDLKKTFAEGAQTKDKGNIDTEENGDGVHDDHQRKRESNRGEDEGRTVGVRGMINNGKRRDMDEESEDDDISEEDFEEEEEKEGDARGYNFKEEEDDADDEEEEEDREDDRARAAGEENCEKREEKEEQLEEKEDGSSRKEGRAENVDNCEEEEENVMGAKCKEKEEEEGEEEEDEVEDTERNRAMYTEDEEENGDVYTGLLGDEAGRVVDHVFREEGGNRIEGIVEFRKRFGEGLAVIEDNPREGFDKEDERDTEEEEEEEDEEDKVESAKLSDDEEELKKGDEEEIAAGDFGVFGRLKEVGVKEENEGDAGKGEEKEGGINVEEEEKKEGREPEEVKRAEEVRRAEEEVEEGEIIEEKAEEEEEEEEEDNIASPAGLKMGHHEMFSDDVAHRVGETAEVKAMFELLDEEMATEEEKVAGEREETEKQDRSQALVKMKDVIIKVDKEGEALSGDCGDEEEGEEQDNHVTNAKHYEEIVMAVEVDKKEKTEHKLMSVEEATGRGRCNEITQEKNIKMCTNPHHHHYHYNIHPNWTSACSESSQTSSEESLIPDSLATSCDVTQSELKLLLVLWMLLYCYFILPEINL